MAFIKEIRQNTIDSHQISPGYVITFLRWSNRDTKNYNISDGLETRDPMVVTSDATNISVSNTKGGLSPTASINLMGGDIDYATAVHPGDFVLINMLNWEEDVIRVSDKAKGKLPINEIGDGFKGVFKVQNIVKNLRVDPGSGTKSLTYTVTAAGFTEFNNVIYYNPAIAAAFAQTGTAMYSAAISDFYQTNLKTNSDVQIIVEDLFKILIGKSRKKPDPKVPNYGNTHFRVPILLGALLGRPKAKYATDIFTYIIGTWKDSKESLISDINIGEGFNPGFKRSSPDDYFYSTGKSIQGNKEVFIENWNQNTAWSIIQGNINSVMNEIYTTYRIDLDNKIMPTIVVRQKPFTSEHFSEGYNVTKFLQLPRWKISANLLLSMQVSKNEAARYNFVQVFTRSLASTADQDMTNQIILGNYVIDDKDIQRHGLKPYVVTANFDFPIKDREKTLRAPQWSRIVSDWIIDGHLKESGTFSFVGIQDPISVGDNLEFDNIVYHIESISHTMAIQNERKMFRTTLTVSYGMDKRSSKAGPVYANMEHTDAHTRNVEDYEHERILPGVSDTQDVSGRVVGEEVVETIQKSFTPSGLNKKREKDKESNTGEDRNYQIDDKGRSTNKKGK